MFNENMSWDELKAKKKAFYKRMETDFDFRMEQIDKKLLFLNSTYGATPRYVRYKTTVHDTVTNKEYEIGIYGQLKEYKNGKSYF